MFDLWTPKLKDTEYGSDAYREALAGMGEGLMHHYANNRHHPEHFQDGIDSMTLIDLVEMVCDWMVSAGANGRPVDVGYQAQRFNISDQLARVIENTIIELGSWQ